MGRCVVKGRIRFSGSREFVEHTAVFQTKPGTLSGALLVEMNRLDVGRIETEVFLRALGRGLILPPGPLEILVHKPLIERRRELHDRTYSLGALALNATGFLICATGATKGTWSWTSTAVSGVWNLLTTGCCTMIGCRNRLWPTPGW